LSLTPCLADPKEDVRAAVDKLNTAPNYSWTTTMAIEGGQFTPGTVSGKAEKEGFAVVSQERDGNVTTAVLRGEKGVLKTEDGWVTAEELRASGGGGGGGRFRGGLLRTRLPATEAATILKHVKELKASDGVISGELTEAGAKELATFRPRAGGQTFEPTKASGSVRFWVKDGQLGKMEVKLASTTNVNGEEREFVRTTTYQITEVGTTKVEVPEDAKKKIGA
jgi:hypothetical protein